jgi:hypothetical protein
LQLCTKQKLHLWLGWELFPLGRLFYLCLPIRCCYEECYESHSSNSLFKSVVAKRSANHFSYFAKNDYMLTGINSTICCTFVIPNLSCSIVSTLLA